MMTKEIFVYQKYAIPPRSSILLIVFLAVTSLTQLTTASRYHEDVGRTRTIRSNDQNLSHSVWVDIENDHYQMSFLEWMKYALGDVKDIIEIFVNYLLRRPGYTIMDFSNMTNHPDLTLTTDQLLTKYGYIPRTHNVITEDGYILTLFQIVGRTDEPRKSGKPALLICHGLLSSSDDWLLSGPKESLGYLLSDAGYDVWLFNQRGNFYSRANMYMSANDPKFWDFSWHEIGVYDLPAVIDYMIDVTGQEQIIYLGYSQGATSFFVMLSEKPEYNKKIKLAVLYAAAAYMRHTTSRTLYTLGYFSSAIYNTYTRFHTAEIFGRDSIESKLMRNSCLSKSFLQVFCYTTTVYMFAGYDGTEVNKPLLPIFLNHYPSGMSLKQALHYVQSVAKHTFRQIDYLSAEKNEKVYGQSEPPSYNLNNTKVPVMIFYGKQDALADAEDILDLSQMLPNVILLYEIPFDNINHMDFTWGIHAKEYIYLKTIEFLDKALKKGGP